MNDILKTYMERFRENRHTLRRYTAFVLALAMITTLFVNWQLHGVGISMTAQYQCGEEEHTHTADCYTKVLTCGYEEGELENAAEVAAAEADQPSAEDEIMPLELEPQIEFVPHEHTDDCYTEVQTLTCLEEEHVHDDDCFDPEDGSLICDKFEHTHDESCYTTEYELTCGLEDGELVEQVVEPTQSAALAAMAVAEPVALAPMVDTVEPIYHHHTDACYEEVLTCPLPEHHHTVACLSDTSADLETPEEWQAANAEAVMTGNWAEDLVSVAQTQLGYEQSEKNFEIDPADGVTLRYYSRYGQSYGNPYGEWDVMFLSYCLKYAGIPQSAIPQEASVLALRSSMSDMEWLLDGEDGSSADVGDIVIYNKYVTRTVAVDSSVDGAADGLDDLFSMDAEGENGAELEESGAAALDTAPAAEDMTTLDTPDLPDTPDTVDTAQPAAKPVDSTDTAMPSVASPAAEPQTTTVTDAEPVETVGIVSDADENTLTVISGDVDGKVAEVTLSNAEVLGVVSVAYAQYADEMLSAAVTGALRASDMLMLAGENPQYTAYFEETKGREDGGITDITFKIGNIKQDGNFSVTEGQTVNVDFTFEIAGGVLKKEEGSNVLTYKGLPKELWPIKDIEKEILHDGHVIGKEVVKTTGEIVLTFDVDSEYFDPQHTFSGAFGYSWEYTKTTTNEDKTIHFDGSNTDITLKKVQNIYITKSDEKEVKITEMADGQTRITYEVMVWSVDGWDDKVWIWDGLKRENENLTKVDYDQNSFKLKKVDASGKSTDVTCKPDFTKNPSDKYKDYDKTFIIDGLDPLKAGEKYVLTYDVLTTRTGWTKLKNTARTDNGQKKEREITLENNVWKSGEYDSANKCINWTVTVNNPTASDLNGYIVNDTLENNAKIDGDVKLYIRQTNNGSWQDANDNAQTPVNITSSVNQNKTGFTYTFPKGSNAMRYEIKYKTTAPADSTSVKNTVEYGKKDHNYFTGESTVQTGTPTPGQKFEPKKTASGTLTAKDAENPNLLVAPWTITANIGKGVYEITDRIPTSWVDGITVDHYGIANELQQQIQNNLTISYIQDGQTKSLPCYDFSSKGISIVAIEYSTDQWYRDAYTAVDPENTDKHVHRFTIKLDTTNCSLDLKQLTLNYNTLVDVSALPEGSRVTVKNALENGNEVSYDYQKPSSDLKISKGWRTMDSSWNTANENHNTVYSPNFTGQEVSYSKFQNDKNTIEYQVLLDLSSINGDLPNMITLIDTLPKGLTYFTYNNNPSASIVFSNGYGKSVWYKDLPKKNSSETMSIDNFFRTAGTLDVAEPAEGADEGQTLTFHLDGLNQLDFAKLKNQGYTELVLRYRVQVTDERWSSVKFDQHTYTNHIKWKEEDKNSFVDVNVIQKVDALEKTATQIKDKKDSRVKYTLIINPAAKDLLPNGDKITLTDVLKVKSDGVQASLDLTSIHLYNTDTGNEISKDEYSFTPPALKIESDGRMTYTTTFTLPDATPLKLEYEYVTDAKDTVRLKNEATLTGDYTASTHETYDKVDGYAHVYQAKLTVYKVDKRNYSNFLTGAVFKLEYYDSEANSWKQVDPPEYEVDSKGKLVFHFAGTDTLNANTLYKLTETTAPTGYSAASTPYYFIYHSGNTETEAYNVAVGTASSDVPEMSKVLFCTSDKTNELFVPNTANSLTIIKHWKNQNGDTLKAEDVKLSTVDVELYCYKKGESKDTAQPYKRVQLTKDAGWTTTVAIDEQHLEGYIFYIKETNVNATLFTVIYDQPDGVEVGSTLSFTNKDTGYTEYELPSTGGSGTLPYTAVGGTMMLSALAYSFIHRKRRREGRADD